MEGGVAVTLLDDRIHLHDVLLQEDLGGGGGGGVGKGV